MFDYDFSELCSAAIRSLALPVLHKFFNRLERYLLLEPERLDYFTCLCQHISLNHALIRVLGVPFLSYGHAHKCIELLSTAELVRQVLHPVLLRKLLVTLLCLIDLHSL